MMFRLGNEMPENEKKNENPVSSWQDLCRWANRTAAAFVSVCIAYSLCAVAQGQVARDRREASLRGRESELRGSRTPSERPSPAQSSEDHQEPEVSPKGMTVAQLKHRFMMLLGQRKQSVELLPVVKELVKQQIIAESYDLAMMDAMMFLRDFQGGVGGGNEYPSALAIAAFAAHHAGNNRLASDLIVHAAESASASDNDEVLQFVQKTEAMLRERFAEDDRTSRPQRTALPVIFGPWPARPVEKGRAIVMVDEAFTCTSRGGVGIEPDPADFAFSVTGPDGNVTQGRGRCVLVDGLQVGEYHVQVSVSRAGKTSQAETTFKVEERPVPPKTTKYAFTNSLGMRFREIPRGSFVMGSNRLHGSTPVDCLPYVVDIEQPYCMAEFEVDQATYRQVLGLKGIDPRLARHPIYGITYEQAMVFCEVLNQLPAEIAAGRRYRLPTETEWEYACRAGTETAFHLGDTIGEEGVAFGSRGVSAYGTRDTARVDSHPPNAYGLYHMHGNVAEWCQDRYVPVRGWVDRGEPDQLSDAEVFAMTRLNRTSQNFWGDWNAAGLPGVKRSIDKGASNRFGTAHSAFSLRESLKKTYTLRGGTYSSQWSKVRSASRAGAAHNSAYMSLRGIRLVCEKVDPSQSANMATTGGNWGKPWGFEVEKDGTLSMVRQTELNQAHGCVLSKKKYRDFEIEFEIKLLSEGHFGAVSFVFRATPSGYDPPGVGEMPSVVLGEYKKSRWFHGRQGKWGSLNYLGFGLDSKYGSSDRKVSAFQDRLEQLIEENQFVKVKIRCVGSDLSVTIHGETINYYGLQMPKLGNIAFVGSVDPHSRIETSIRNLKVVDLSAGQSPNSPDPTINERLQPKEDSPPNPNRPGARNSFSGKWENDRGVVFRLTQRGERVTGYYFNPKSPSVRGQLIGAVTQNVFTGRYRTPYGTGDVVWTRSAPNVVNVKWQDARGPKGTYTARRQPGN